MSSNWHKDLPAMKLRSLHLTFVLCACCHSEDGEAHFEMSDTLSALGNWSFRFRSGIVRV